MIPKRAKRVFKGIIFDVYQWKEKMYDSSFKTFEGIKRRPSVQLIVVVGDKLLLQREEQPYSGKFISVPGGVVDENETPLSAAKRELLEETGMRASRISLYKKTQLFKKVEWNTYYYIMKDCRKIAEQHLDSGEKITPMLVTFEKFVKLVSGSEFRNKEFSNYVFRLMHDKAKLEEFRKTIFT